MTGGTPPGAAPLASGAAPPAPSPEGGAAELRVEGIGVAPGVAVGEVYLYGGGGYQAEPEHLDADAVEAEVGRFERAVARSERELKKIRLVARQKLGDGSVGIFDAQALILRDGQFYDAVVRRVRDERQGAGWAVQSVMEGLRRRLESSATAALRERAADFLDVQDRVLRNLQQGRAVSRIDRDRVVVAERLSAADVLLFSRHGVRAVVMDFGGPTSHVAIMARALGVPAVVSLHGLAGRVGAGETVVVDGFSGTVIARPTEETRAAAQVKADRFARLSEDRAEVAAAPSETRDGHAVALQANVEFREEFPLLHEYGAEGRRPVPHRDAVPHPGPRARRGAAVRGLPRRRGRRRPARGHVPAPRPRRRQGAPDGAPRGEPDARVARPPHPPRQGRPPAPAAPGRAPRRRRGPGRRPAPRPAPDGVRARRGPPVPPRLPVGVRRARGRGRRAPGRPPARDHGRGPVGGAPRGHVRAPRRLLLGRHQRPHAVHAGRRPRERPRRRALPRAPPRRARAHPPDGRGGGRGRASRWACAARWRPTRA